MLEIISDSTKFKPLQENLATYLLKLEDKLNRILRSIKDVMGTTVYSDCYASGSRPGRLYGLPKIHKANVPMRPIISSIGTFSYNVAKFLVPIVFPLTTNEYTLDNSAKFVKEICSLNLPHQTVMASFDVESLFTNIPLNETIDIILCKFREGDYDTKGLSEQTLLKLLKITTSESVFTFKDKLYSQIDGVSMGSPLSCCLANIFLCHFEKLWLDDCPPDFKPLFYRRYVDDTFLLFRSDTHIEPFLEYMNNRHANIRFTKEVETDGKLSFLDTVITREGNSFSTSVFRKDTFTGLGMNFLSHVPTIFKINSVKTLITRAYDICSSYFLLDIEIKFLENYFIDNGYPKRVFNQVLNNFLNFKFSPPPMKMTARKQVKYVKLPFVGELSYEIRRSLQSTFRKYFPQIKFQIVFTNRFTIGSLFKAKDSLPSDLCSNIVYGFSCPSCGAGYVGSTSRWLQHRILEHRGRSVRTGALLVKPTQSAIRDHAFAENHPFTHEDFKILAKPDTKLDLLISETLIIKMKKPTLNVSTTSVQLFLQ